MNTLGDGIDVVALDRRELLARFDGDKSLLDELIDLFRDESAKLLDQLDVACRTSDRTVLKQAAHRLRGAASNFEAGATMAAARRLELLAADGDGEQLARAWQRLETELGHLHSHLKPRLADTLPLTIKECRA